MASNVGDLIASITPAEYEAIVSLYNEQDFANPQLSVKKLDQFLHQLRALDVIESEDDIKVVVSFRDSDIDIAGSGWGFYDDATWTHMDRWDVEWRPAAEVLGLELDDRTGVARTVLIVWILEELGVYLNAPRT